MKRGKSVVQYQTELVEKEKTEPAKQFEMIIEQAHRESAAPVTGAGVIIGTLTGVSNKGKVFVEFAGRGSKEPIAARSTVSFNENDIGNSVAVLFENGDPRKPLAIGRVYDHPSLPKETEKQPEVNNITISRDGKRVLYRAEQEIVLQCGKASITLTKAGKILIKGEYISTHSTGVNRIKGGSVQLN